MEHLSHVLVEQAKGEDWFSEGFGFAPLVLCLGHRQRKSEFSCLFKLQVSELSSLLALRLRLLWGPCGYRRAEAVSALAVRRVWAGQR